MSGKDKIHPTLKWRLESLGHSLIEGLAGMLPGPWLFRMGEAIGGLVVHFIPLRRKIILRNLRIAFAGEKDLAELRRMTRETIRRTGANMVSAAHTARLSPEKLGEVIDIENLELLEQALASGKGVVLLLAHMGNWEVLSRLIHFFPQGSRAGAFYRPLANQLMDQRVLARRQADGTRMFSKGDNPLHVAAFLREGGIVGILADQRVGFQGELVRFFGRVTRASPLPSLLARRARSEVLALSLKTREPGKWSARFVPVGPTRGTADCMRALQQAMEISPVDVFWFQERWKTYVLAKRSVHEWLEGETSIPGKPHRALIWLAGASADWQAPDGWLHPDVVYEVVLDSGQSLPPWLPGGTVVHAAPLGNDSSVLQKAISVIDESAALPLDFIVTTGASKPLVKASRREAVPLVSLP